jgi:formamidopyrimidine-DNA glycosylase
MPELPDVEIFRRRLAHGGLNRRIDRVQVTDPSAVEGISRQRLGQRLRGHRLTSTRRHGKHLFASIDDGGWLVMHFGMTGFLECRPSTDDPTGHVRAVLHLDDGSRLVYDDQRRLGFIALTEDVSDYIAGHRLGPDALDVGFTDLRDTLRSRRGAVKPALMDQEAIAGIGNIYSDEILFQARVHPRAAAAGLSDASYHRLHRQVRRVLTMAADRNADPDRMPRSWLLPHRQDGLPCPRGRGTVCKISISGRGAFYCTECQAL